MFNLSVLLSPDVSDSDSLHQTYIMWLKPFDKGNMSNIFHNRLLQQTKIN